MGLDVTVMPVSKVLQNENRSADHQAFLEASGLAMPAGSDEDFGYTEQVGPYAVYHHLWRYAAHLEVNGIPPDEPGTHPLDDPVYQEAIGKVKTKFEHLFRHSEDSGYYYPIDFEKPFQIIPEIKTGFLQKIFRASKEPVSPVTYGSAVRLHEELLLINEHLKVPVRDESPSQTYEDGIHGDEWGDEKWTWVVLFFMCRKAIEHGQIVVFE